MDVLSYEHDGVTYIRDCFGYIMSVKGHELSPYDERYRIISENLPNCNFTTLDVHGIMVCLVDRETVSICGNFYKLCDFKRFFKSLETPREMVSFDGWYFPYKKTLEWLDTYTRYIPNVDKEALKVVEKITKGL